MGHLAMDLSLRELHDVFVNAIETCFHFHKLHSVSFCRDYVAFLFTKGEMNETFFLKNEKLACVLRFTVTIIMNKSQ